MERLSFDIRIPETVQNEGLALHQAPETMVLKLRKKSIRATLNRSKSTRSTASRFSLTRSRRNILAEEDGSGTCDPWRLCWTISTACIPSALMTKAGIKKESHQAWREKVTLCMICCLFMALLGFLAFGFNNSACNTKASLFPILAFNTESIFKSRKNQNLVSIRGYVYDIRSVFDRHAQYPFFTQNPSLNLNQNSTGLDASSLFPPALSAKCLSLLGGRLQIKCVNGESFPGIGYCHKWDSVESQLLALLKGVVIYDWDIIDVPFSKLTVYNNQVINIATYLGTESRVFSPEIDLIIRSHAGKDLSKALQVVKNGPQVGQCLAQLYMVGKIESDDGICLLSQAMLYVSLVIIVSVVLLRFLVALYFRWIKNPDFKIEKLKQEKHHSMRASNNSFPFGIDSSIVISKRSNTVRSTSPFGVQPYCIMFVTCYSESDASIRSTLDSLALTVYSEERKLLFIVQDGLVKGSDNPISTPEILLNMLELDEKWPLPIAFPYMAVADGKRQINYAKVYVAWYNVSGRSIPTILVVKTGSPEEVTEAKPGNRGKRDSQILFMRFLEHITFNDRLSPFEYDLFQKMHYIMGATPEVFEYILFVDADTKVEPDSLPRMAACMSEDPMVMGLCGETRIGNKTDSYISRIQVFEYYLSHHLAKAFESTFGTVTCLPGCFSMYRIKAPTENGWLPILASPDIISVYSQVVVDTLHKKNLLLLGEDRFLTTMMLRTFPKRKLIFVRKAYCKTIVPTTFKVLLSQRRRWINSTIHNLMELLFVNDLCGTFCFSMQFIILLELIGTVTLPSAICFTLYVILYSAIKTVEWAPLILLFLILVLPAFLILLTTNRIVHVYWMFIYLTALPIWNFVLPVYAFWHFDDFSWGETRKIAGDDETNHDGHSTSKIMGNLQIPLKKWEEWERERRSFLYLNIKNQS